jgi:hypothetical protein
VRRSLRSIVVLTLVVALLGAGPAALAAWNNSSDGAGRARAITMPSGNTPWTSVANRNVTVSWTAVTMPGGVPVDGYKVFRYDAGGTAFPVTGSCTGVIGGLTCTETAMAPGSWRYAVAPVYELWQGAEGPRSSPAVVAAPQLNLTGSTNITSFPATLNGTVTNYIPGQTLTMRLDHPTTGQVLTANVTPNSIPASGTATVQVTVPNTVANGTRTLYAVGSGPDMASDTFTVNAPYLTPTALALINGSGSTSGQIQQNDSLQVTFSQPLLVSTVCTGAPDDNQPVTAPGFVRITNNNGTSGHDLLIVDTALCPGGLRFGSISLGSSGFVSSTQQFDATITYTPATRRVTAVLGARTTGGTAPARVNQSVTATYTPHPAMMATNGRLITGTVSSTGVQF